MRPLEELLAEPPRLHHWSGRWQVGGIKGALAEAVVFELKRLPGFRVIETGAGLSTLLFLCMSTEPVVSIAPDSGLFDRIAQEARRRGVKADHLEAHVGYSELVLPQLMGDGRRFNVAFIDGGHGWPTVFVDFCYMNAMLDKSGLLFLDDLQLHSVQQLNLLLLEQPGFEEVRNLGGKMAAFRKTTDAPFLPDHTQQPFIVASSKAPV